MLQVKEMPYQEKVDMYKGLTKLTLINMLIEANNTISRLTQRDVEVSSSAVTTSSDYEFNTHQHWKSEDDTTGYDSKPVGGFSNW